MHRPTYELREVIAAEQNVNNAKMWRITMSCGHHAHLVQFASPVGKMAKCFLCHSNVGRRNGFAIPSY